MARLSRAQTRERNRAKVLAAAREEFTERGYRDAKVDAIAERADLTRGAVYSNFPGKRALYFAVLAELSSSRPVSPGSRPGTDGRSAIGAFAREWVARWDEQRLARHALPEIVADERVQPVFTQLLELGALLLALAWEAVDPPARPAGAPPARRVRAAGTVLTTLHGASQLFAVAPEFGQPFDVVSACEQLSSLALNDFWPPVTSRPQVSTVDDPWDGAVSGVVHVLGLHRLAAAEEGVRAGVPVTVIPVTSDPGELIPLARWAVADVAHCLRQAFPAAACERLRVAFETPPIDGLTDDTVLALFVENGRVVARAEGEGAGDAIARVHKAGVEHRSH